MATELLTLAEVAARLRVSHDTVYRLALSGKLSGTKVGRSWRFPAEAIEHLLESEIKGQADHEPDSIGIEEQLDFRDLYENAPDMCLSVDVRTERILCCNATTVATTGFSRDEIIGRPVAQMYDPSCSDRSREILHQLRTTGSVRDAEMVLLTKSGKRWDRQRSVHFSRIWP